MWGGNIGDGIFDETAKQQKSCMRILIFKSVIILQFQWMWDFDWSLGAELSSRKSFLARILKIPGKLAKTFPEGGAPAAKKPRRRLPKQKQQPEKKISDFDQKVMAILLRPVCPSTCRLLPLLPGTLPFSRLWLWNDPRRSERHLPWRRSWWQQHQCSAISVPTRSSLQVRVNEQWKGEEKVLFGKKEKEKALQGFSLEKAPGDGETKVGATAVSFTGDRGTCQGSLPPVTWLQGAFGRLGWTALSLEKKRKGNVSVISWKSPFDTDAGPSVKPLVREWGHFVEPVRVHDWAGPRRCCLCLLRLWSHGCIAGRSLSSPSHRRHCCSHQQGPTGSQAQLWSHPS